MTAAEPDEIPVLEGQATIDDLIEGGDNGLHEGGVL